MTDADVVLAALRSWGGPDGTVCAPIQEIVALTELGDHAVRAALAELIADGRLVFTGRRVRKTAVYRFASPAPTPRSEQSTEAPPEGATSVTSADATCDGDDPSPHVASTDDEEELSEEEWAERRRIGLRHAYAFLDRYDAAIGSPDQPEGECGECGRHAQRRYSLGMFVLCRECRLRRARVAARIGQPTEQLLRVVKAGPELVDGLVEELTEQLGRNGSNGDSPLWDEPEF